jgi:hypothetical protein
MFFSLDKAKKLVAIFLGVGTLQVLYPECPSALFTYLRHHPHLFPTPLPPISSTIATSLISAQLICHLAPEAFTSTAGYIPPNHQPCHRPCHQPCHQPCHRPCHSLCHPPHQPHHHRPCHQSCHQPRHQPHHQPNHQPCRRHRPRHQPCHQSPHRPCHRPHH